MVPVVVPVPASAPDQATLDHRLDEERRRELGITQREFEVFGWIAAGLSTREIAERLFVSENTVKTHCGRLFDKLGARSLGGIRDSADRSGVDLDPGRA